LSRFALRLLCNRDVARLPWRVTQPHFHRHLQSRFFVRLPCIPAKERDNRCANHPGYRVSLQPLRGHRLWSPGARSPGRRRIALRACWRLLRSLLAAFGARYVSHSKPCNCVLWVTGDRTRRLRENTADYHSLGRRLANPLGKLLHRAHTKTPPNRRGQRSGSSGVPYQRYRIAMYRFATTTLIC